MTIETPPSEEKNALQKALLGIAAKIDVPRNSWEEKWYDLAVKVGNTQAEVEAAAAKKRPQLTKLT